MRHLRKLGYTRNAWWRHQMETFSALLVICAWNSLVPVNSPYKAQWSGALLFSLIFARMNGGVNNHGAGDLRRHHGHCDVNVMDVRALAMRTFNNDLSRIINPEKRQYACPETQIFGCLVDAPCRHLTEHFCAVHGWYGPEESHWQEYWPVGRKNRGSQRDRDNLHHRYHFIIVTFTLQWIVCQLRWNDQFLNLCMRHLSWIREN